MGVCVVDELVVVQVGGNPNEGLGKPVAENLGILTEVRVND